MKELEKHIKEKLEQRTLEPSAAAWTKIQSQMHQKPKRLSIGFWMSAASVLLLMGVGVSVLFSDDESLPVQVVVQELEEVSSVKNTEVVCENSTAPKEKNTHKEPQPTVRSQKPVLSTSRVKVRGQEERQQEQYIAEVVEEKPQKQEEKAMTQVDVAQVEKKRKSVQQEAERLLANAQDELIEREERLYVAEIKMKSAVDEHQTKERVVLDYGRVKKQVKEKFHQMLDELKDVVVFRY